MKKRISLMVAVIIVLQIILPMVSVMWESGITLISRAEEKITSGEWEYTVNEDGQTITIVHYNGTEDNLVIPNQIDGYTVTALGGHTTSGSDMGEYGAFLYRNLTTVKLPDTLKIIKNSAFLNCKKLETIEINSGLETIEQKAFEGCINLKDIELNEGLKFLGFNVFDNCQKITEITIPSSVETIECQININAFYKVDSLANIIVHADNPYYSSEEGVVFNKEKTILIAYPNAKKDESYSIPDGVTHVYGKAFRNPYLKNLSISQYTTNLYGQREYSNYYNTFAISECRNLQNIIVDQLNQEYSSENGIIYNKEKTELLVYPSGKQDLYYTMPDSVSSIPNAVNIYESYETMNNSYLEKIKLSNLIDNVEFLMEMTNLKNIEIDTENTYFTQKDGVLFNKDGNKIVYYPMGRTEETYTIDSNVVEIGSKAFMNSKLTRINLSNNTSAIGEYAFYNCTNLKNIVLPTTMTEIGKYAFSNCPNIEEINIPEGVADTDAFGKNDKLRYITFPNTIEIFPSYVFDSGYSTKYDKAKIVTIYNENPTSLSGLAFPTPDSGYTVLRCYSTATKVIEYSNSHRYIQYNLLDLDEDDEKFLYTIDNNEVKISDYIGDEENVEIPREIEGLPVTSIDECIGTYKSLTIPSTIEEIGRIYSLNLENIYVNAESQYFTSKDGILFNKNEEKLLCYPMAKETTSYNIEEGVTYIEDYAFDGNVYLEKITIPKSVEEIGYSTLNMESLSEIVVDEQNQNYISKDNIIYKINEDNIEIEEIPLNIKGDVELLYGLTEIDTYEFEDINEIKSVVVPMTVTKISNNAFYNCNSLKKLVILSNTIELSEYNSANLSFGHVNDELKVYCEENSTVQEYSKKWGIDYEIIETSKIEVKQNPQKLYYIKDEESLDLEGGLITIIYNDGTELDLSMGSDLLNISGFDNSNLGSKQIEVDYNGNKANFVVNIIILLKGDVNGDNKIDFMDILAINKHRLGKEQLIEIFLESADVNEDGNIDFIDILQVNKYRLGKIDSL